MVQQLDGTVNEWGWCKQKVQSRFLTRLVHLNHVQWRVTNASVRKSESIQVEGTKKDRGRTCELSRSNKRGLSHNREYDFK